MSRKRMPGESRKNSILQAARRVFSQRGFEAAKTLDIARAAGVSEALVYRHFPSKLALYRAVLRALIREQDEMNARLGVQNQTCQGLVTALKAYFTFLITPDPAEREAQQNFRLLLASLAGDGNYALLIYRRAQRIIGPTIQAALLDGRAKGDIQGESLAFENTSMFIEHVGIMMSAVSALPSGGTLYAEQGDALVRQAVWFCCRGIGMTDQAIATYFQS